MTSEEATIGTVVSSTVAFAGVPERSLGIIDEDYGTGVTIRWLEITGWKPLRDGFSKDRDLQYLKKERVLQYGQSRDIHRAQPVKLVKGFGLVTDHFAVPEMYPGPTLSFITVEGRGDIPVDEEVLQMLLVEPEKV